VLRRLDGESAERRNDVALGVSNAACPHEEFVRAARAKHVVSPCAVQVHVNVAWDDQPLNTTRTCSECATASRSRHGDNLSDTARVNTNQDVVKDLAANECGAADATHRGGSGCH
jgi:hypothetical protein